MLNASKFNNRDQLVLAMPKRLAWAEIGVDRATFSQVILDLANPSYLALIDNWKHDDVPGLDNPDDAMQDINCSQEEKQRRYQGVVEKFKDDARVHIIRDYSLPAAAGYADDTFDVVYLDANHFQAYEDATAWWPKIRLGGYLCGHDYIDTALYEPAEWVRVKEDIDRFAAERGLLLTATQERWATWLIHKETD